MAVLVTGVAGFIGFHTAKALISRGDHVIGVDNLNDYYDIGLKQARLDQLATHKNFSFYKYDITDRDAMIALASSSVTHIIHLAAQAGVRYSLENPYTYVASNIMGHVVMLEMARLCDQLKHFVYASSSSVYGSNTKIPFSIEDQVDHPVSVYAATKRADELLSWTYAHLYNLPMTGLRFFTVYGPWGRPDMAYYHFVRSIMSGSPIKVFNQGKMRRDFTFIDDIVQGILAANDQLPVTQSGHPPIRTYNLGNSKAENLMDFIAVIEKSLGQKARYDFQPIQPGDIPETYADIEATTRDLGYRPTTSIDTGIPLFVDWYRKYHGMI